MQDRIKVSDLINLGSQLPRLLSQLDLCITVCDKASGGLPTVGEGGQCCGKQLGPFSQNVGLRGGKGNRELFGGRSASTLPDSLSCSAPLWKVPSQSLVPRLQCARLVSYPAGIFPAV